MPRTKSLGKSRVTLYTVHDLRSAELDDLSPDEKWAWTALRLLVADCPYRPILCLSPGVPLTDEQIAIQLRVPLALWRRTQKKLISHKRIVVDKRGVVVGRWSMPSMYRTWEMRVPTEDEIKQDQQERVKISMIWEEVVGITPDPNHSSVVRNFDGRKKEGATERDFEIAARTYLGIVTRGTLGQNLCMTMSRMLSRATFWKLVKVNRPVYGRSSTTIDYFKSLRRGMRTFAREAMRDYTVLIREYMTKEGIRCMIDVDWTKVMTCLEYLKRRVSGEFEGGEGPVWPADKAR